MQSDKIIIGFDAKRALSNYTGLGSYSRTLIDALVKANTQNKFSFLLYSPKNYENNLLNQIIIDDNLHFVYPKYANIKLLRDWWREKGIVKDLLRDKVNVFHGLSGQLPQGIKAKGIKSIVTIHDLIFFTHPEFYNPIDVKIYSYKFHKTLKEATKVVAISECTKRDILRYGDIDESKIEVIYQSYNKIFDSCVKNEEKQRIRQKYLLSDRFILNVGSIERRKNILLAIKAMNYVPQDVHLVIIGKNTTYVKELKTYIKENNLIDRVHIFHNVSNEDLKTIYSLASLFVYPSIYEGFGIPIIEAIANNLPVIACSGSCLEEAGGEHSYYIGTKDVSGMQNIINTLLNNEDKRLLAINESKKYIKKFANNDIAQKFLNLYEM